MEQKQVRLQFSHETMEELRKRVLDLEEQNRVLDAFIENSTDAIQISDRNLVTLRINRAYEVLTGPLLRIRFPQPAPETAPWVPWWAGE